MKKLPYQTVILISQVLSIFMTVSVFVLDYRIGLTTKEVEIYGGNLTMLLIVITAINHFNAKKGKVHLGSLCALALIAPVYALIGGEIKFVISYHGFVLLAHALTWMVLSKKAAPKEESEA